MLLAVSAKGKNLEDDIDVFFGRCIYFLVVDTEKMEVVEVIENEFKDQGGAGIKAAKLVTEKDVEAVISGNLGPRALDVLKQFDIKTYIAEGNIRSAIESLKQGTLKESGGE